MSFKKAYQLLKHKSDMKFSIGVYHHDHDSEPFISVESYVDKIALDYVEGQGLIINIFTSDTTYSFSENNWLEHVDDRYISFRSANDDETHCIIEFC